MSNKQTAVEWLEQQIGSKIADANIRISAPKFYELINQAKELEKQQELKEWIEAWSLGYDSGFNNCMKKFNNKQ
jgi:hypothetical protein